MRCCIVREIPQITKTFAFFDPPWMGNVMTPVYTMIHLRTKWKTLGSSPSANLWIVPIPTIMAARVTTLFVEDDPYEQ